MFKRTVCILGCFLIILSISGCGRNNSGDGSKTINEDTDTVKNKFNLNDNIEVYEDEVGLLEQCGFVVFATNIKEVFPNAQITNNSVHYWDGTEADSEESEISKEKFESNFDRIKFDVKKENEAKDKLNSVDDKTEGMTDFNYKYNNHRFIYHYMYVAFKDEKYTTTATKLNKDINNVFKDSIRFLGTCGGMFDEYKLLDEELCDKYHLVCDRW